MTPSPLKARIEQDVKDALRAQDRRRLMVLRMIMAAVKQREIDDRVTVDDALVIGVLDKMRRQRRESLEQYQKAGRADLAEQEAYEIELIQAYMPQGLSSDEIHGLIEMAIATTAAVGIKDMGRVMQVLRGELQGRADMSFVSAQIKQRLSG